MKILIKYTTSPLIQDFAIRSLLKHGPNINFFYIPQLVQLLRYDSKGMIKSFILETASLSQLFAHQIIWNMHANYFVDEQATKPDPLKPIFEQIAQDVISKMNNQEKDFYEREFKFFESVTAISGSLKPFIKKTKEEKKVF